MNANRRFPRFALAACVALLGAADVFAVRRTEDPIALVPASAATVAVIRWNELRDSPLGAKVFAEMDTVSADGDGARFLHEAGLDPKRDVDTIFLAMSPGGSAPNEDALVFFEGRFDVDRLAKALVARGGVRKAASGSDYYILPESKDSGSAHSGSGSVAFVNRQLVVAGDEAAVVAVLARRESGGAGGLMSGQGLGKHLSRIDQHASAWALVDLTRFPSTQNREAHVEIHGESNDGPSRAIVGVMKSVTLVALQATVHGDAIDVSASGVSSDAENRSLIEDSLRGVLAAWRLAIQDKSPELVAVLRRFKIEDDGEAVSIRGTLPGSLLRSLAASQTASR